MTNLLIIIALMALCYAVVAGFAMFSPVLGIFVAFVLVSAAIS